VDLLNFAKDVKLAMTLAIATAMTRILAHLDLPVLPVSLALTAKEVPMERRENLDRPVPSPHGSKCRLLDLASNAHQVRKEQLDHQANQARLARKAFPAARATTANQAQLAKLVTRDHLVHPDPAANPVRRDHLVTMPKKARKAHQANQERRDHPDPQDPTETKVQAAKLVHQVREDHPDHLVPAESPETKVPLEKPARLANRVRMPTIVLARNARPRLRRSRRRKPKLKRRLVNDEQWKKPIYVPLVLDNILPQFSMQFLFSHSDQEFAILKTVHPITLDQK